MSPARATPPPARGNYLYLLASLLLLLFIGPIMAQFGGTYGGLAEVAMAATLLVGVWTLIVDRTWFTLGLVLCIAGIILSGLSMMLGGALWFSLALAAMLLFLILSVVIALADVAYRGRVDTNKVIGTICIFLLLGVIWAFLYTLILTFSPGAFSNISSEEHSVQLMELTYYSFVTLSTLGYGDILPVAPLARAFAYMEAVFGQFYIAILVASLVGIHISDRQADGEKPSP